MRRNGRNRILLVEDEFISALVMQSDLEKTGYHITNTVATAADAVLSAKVDSPDLILMDIRLAGEMDGIEAATIIRETAEIPIIFITGYDDEATRERAAKANPAAFLVKPVAMQELRTTLDAVWNRLDIESGE